MIICLIKTIKFNYIGRCSTFTNEILLDMNDNSNTNIIGSLKNKYILIQILHIKKK